MTHGGSTNSQLILNWLLHFRTCVRLGWVPNVAVRLLLRFLGKRLKLSGQKSFALRGKHWQPRAKFCAVPSQIMIGLGWTRSDFKACIASVLCHMALIASKGSRLRLLQLLLLQSSQSCSHEDGPVLETMCQKIFPGNYVLASEKIPIGRAIKETQQNVIWEWPRGIWVTSVKTSTNRFWNIQVTWACSTII